MELLSLSQIPKNKHQQVFRVAGKYNPHLLIIFAFVFVGILQFCIPLFLEYPYVAVVTCVFLLVFTILLYFKIFHNNISMSRRILVLDKKGVYVNIPVKHSSFNKKVLHVSLHEIKSIQKICRNAAVKGIGSSDRVFLSFTFLDISLCNPILELDSNFEYEQEDDDSEKYNIAKLFQDCQSLQVTLRNPFTIRIRFDNLSSPIMSAILYFCQNRICVNKDGYEEITSSPEEQSQMKNILAQMVSDGERANAIRLAQKVYGLEKTDAEQMVRQIGMVVGGN